MQKLWTQTWMTGTTHRIILLVELGVVAVAVHANLPLPMMDHQALKMTRSRSRILTTPRFQLQMRMTTPQTFHHLLTEYLDQILMLESDGRASHHFRRNSLRSSPNPPLLFAFPYALLTCINAPIIDHAPYPMSLVPCKYVPKPLVPRVMSLVP